MSIYESLPTCAANFGAGAPIRNVSAFDDSAPWNRMIAEDVVHALDQGRFPIVLADRKEHIRTLDRLVAESSPVKTTYRLEGALSAKMRRQVLMAVGKAREEGRPVVLFATASLVGEGFNLPELDTLFLAAPISFEGRLVQYVGRLQRATTGKSDVAVFDYVDADCPIFLKMFRKRVNTYQKLGYDVIGAGASALGQQLPLFWLDQAVRPKPSLRVDQWQAQPHGLNMITDYQANYIAWLLTQRHPSDSADRLAGALVEGLNGCQANGNAFKNPRTV
jgi:hypothetical protein